MSELVEFYGTIYSVTPDGRSALVRLGTEVGGRQFAVISPATSGRIGVMNGVGELRKGTHVRGSGTLGSEAVMAVSVEEVLEEVVELVD